MTLGYGAADSTDDLLSRIASVTTNFGSIGDVVKYRADIRIEGKVLQLNNLFVEGDIGEAAYFELLEAAKDQARRQGFKRLEIFAVRSSGASPGTIIERAFDL